MPNYNFTGKTALVMGGSKGLGYATAEALAKDGANLILVSRSQASLDEAANKLIHQYGVSVETASVDLSDEAAFNLVLDQYKDVDILISNCGGPPPGKFEEFDLNSWDNAYQGQIRSAVQACKAVVPSMAKRGWGRVIMIASITVGTAFPNLILSNALRPGLLGLAGSLAKEYAANGVTFNLVCPGLTLTDRLASLISNNAQQQNKTEEEIIAGITQAIPAVRLGRPEEFGATAAFLASDGAAYINAQAIYVDGGYLS